MNRKYRRFTTTALYTYVELLSYIYSAFGYVEHVRPNKKWSSEVRLAIEVEY